jgi:hypothetical protein
MISNIYYDRDSIKLILFINDLLKIEDLTDQVIDKAEFIIETKERALKIYHGDNYDKRKSDLYFNHDVYKTNNLFDIMIKGLISKYDYFNIVNYDINKFARDLWIMNVLEKEMNNND